MYNSLRRTKILLVFAALLLTTSASAQNFNWVRSAATLGSAVTTDPNHNTLITGHYDGSTQFGNISLTHNGQSDGFIAKYNQAGNVVWAKGFGGSGYDLPMAITTDATGNVYVCGYFLSPFVRFTATDTLQIGGAVGLFLAKYDSSGNFQWARRASVPSNISTSAGAVRVDGAGNVIMGGTFGGTINFGTVSLTGSGSGSSLYLVKYTSAGSVVWAKAGVTTSYSQMNGVAVDGAGNIYATGKLGAPVNWGTGQQPITGTEQVYVAKFNSAGTLQWMKEEGKPVPGGTTFNIYDSGNGIAVDGAGNVYVGGSLVDTIFVNPATIIVEGRQRAMIAKYNSAGVQQWLKRIGGGNEHTVVNSVGVDAAGNPYIIGNYKDTASISGTVLPAATSRDIFIARLTPAGNVSWFRAVGGGRADHGAGIAIDADGSVVTTGSFDSLMASFGPLTITGPGITNGFFSRQSNTVVTGISHTTEVNDVEVFPSPATTTVYISSKCPEEWQATVTDALGRNVFMTELGYGLKAFDVHALPTGGYVVSLRSKRGESRTLRFVKQ